MNREMHGTMILRSSFSPRSYGQGSDLMRLVPIMTIGMGSKHEYVVYDKQDKLCSMPFLGRDGAIVLGPGTLTIPG